VTLSPEGRELLTELARRWRSSRSRAIERAVECAWLSLPDPVSLEQKPRSQASAGDPPKR